MKGRSEYVGLLDKAEGLGKKKSRHKRYTHETKSSVGRGCL